MWLAWSNGAVLVPIKRQTLVSGPDLAHHLRRLRIDVLSTVPSIAKFLSGEDLGALRLLILGGEAVSPALVKGLLRPKMELWNTYGPTETTVIATAAQLQIDRQITIGEPIAGMSIAVIDDYNQLVALGSIGQLVISGIGLGRYIDKSRDAEKYKALPALGWARAYFTGDYVRVTSHGLEFVGRVDDQIKIAGKRLDLAEIELAASGVAGVVENAAIAKTSKLGNTSILLFLVAKSGYSKNSIKKEIEATLPAGVRPSLHFLSELPLKTSGKVDKRKLSQGSQFPVAEQSSGSLTARLFAKVLDVEAVGEEDNFFNLGGTSISVAQLVVELRREFSAVTVADVYKHPTPLSLEMYLASRKSAGKALAEPSATRLRSASLRTAVAIGLQILYGGVALGVLRAILSTSALGLSQSTLAAILLVSIAAFSAPVRALLAGSLIRLTTLGLIDGQYEKNGATHNRIWLAERIADMFNIVEFSGTPWMIFFTRLTGSKIGKNCTIDSLPSVLGNLRLGDNSTIGRDVHLSGWAFHNNRVVIGGYQIAENCRIGNRSFIGEGVSIGPSAEVETGTLVDRDIQEGEVMAGSPMQESGRTDWPKETSGKSRLWAFAYIWAQSLQSVLNLVQYVPVLVIFSMTPGGLVSKTLGELAIWAFLVGPLSLVTNAIVSGLVIRFANLFVKPGFFRIESREGFFSWLIERQIQATRRHSFWLYASSFTPAWMRFLGAKVGSNCEISTFNGQVGLATIGNECFLADDVSLAPRETREGWVRLGEVHIEDRSFVGNSALVRATTRLATGTLVGVASEAPADSAPGESFFGLPAIEFPRLELTGNSAFRYKPGFWLRVKRLSVETTRLTTSVVSMHLVFIGLAIAGSPGKSLPDAIGWFLRLGVIYAALSYTAVLVTVAAKWILVGRISVSDHDLWTSFVWRNEVVWNFVESLATPWVGSVSLDTPIQNHIFRMLGAKIAKNVALATWFLDDPDLISIGENTSISKSADLQTHLFHDRLMQLGKVAVGSNSTIGAGSFILPGSLVGDSATISSGSLVARGEEVPNNSNMRGNPIEHQ
jgi:non-ribosomal peptide synthetase-like protein